MRRNYEALASLGLKHASEDLLLAFEDRGLISQRRLEIVSNGLIEYMVEAQEGALFAERRAYLLKRDEKEALSKFDLLKGIIGEEDFAESVGRISETLRRFQLNQHVNSIEEEFAVKFLKKFLRTITLVATPSFPNVPRQIFSQGRRGLCY